MFASGDGSAGTVSPVQSNDTPYDLSIVAPVQLAGSDQQASDFMINDLPILNEAVSDNLSERQVVSGVSALSLDPTQLRLEAEAAVRVYFIDEGAGYHNTLGYYTGDPAQISEGLANTDAQLIFPDASESRNRTESTPLQVGDFVDLGTQSADTQMNFFLVANGAGGGSNVYTADPALNPDGVEHFISLVATPVADSPYLLFGVEDLYGGGDRDYNDLVFSVDLGYENVAALVAATVPLPSGVIALLGAFFCIALSHARRKRTKVNALGTRLARPAQ